MSKRMLSLAALTTLDVPPAEQVRIAARIGYTHVGLRLLPATPSEPDYKLLGDTAAVREIRTVLRDTGIGVSDVEIVRLTPDFTLSDRMQQFLETAGELGASQVLVAVNDPQQARCGHNLALLAEAGHQYGLTMNLEPMPWTDAPTIAAARAVIAESGCREVGILVDAIHFWRAGESLEALRALPANTFNYMQLCDAPARAPDSVQGLIDQARGARLVPGEGGLDLHGLLRVLPAGLPVSIEVPLGGEQGRLPPLTRARLLYDAALAYL